MLCHCTCPACPRVSAFRNTLYYNVVQREQILKRKTGARRLLSSHFSHIYCEIFFLTPDAQLSLLLSTQKLCSPLPCWLAELTLPVSPSRMTARKLLQRNLKTIKYKMSRWQVASPLRERPMSPWHHFSACWAALTKSKQEPSPVEVSVRDCPSSTDLTTVTKNLGIGKEL